MVLNINKEIHKTPADFFLSGFLLIFLLKVKKKQLPNFILSQMHTVYMLLS